MAVAANNATYVRLHRRMQEGGEWDRILAVLEEQLNEDGWSDRLYGALKDKARNDSNTVKNLAEDVRQISSDSMPTHIKEHILAMIQAVIQTMLDK